MAVGLGLASFLGAFAAWVGWRRETQRIRQRRFSLCNEPPAGMTTKRYECGWLRLRGAMMTVGWVLVGAISGPALSVLGHALLSLPDN